MKKKNRKLAAVISALLTAALTFSACGQAPSPAEAGGAAAEAQTGADSAGGSAAAGAEGEDAVLHIAMGADIVSMDVQKTTNDYLVPLNIYDPLFKIVKNSDGSTEILKNLVTDYKISDDGLTYSFTLRDGVVFSDGTPLKASDVKFTFERICTLPDSAQTDYAVAIAGAEELMKGEATELKGITVEDDTHFSITLVEPFAGFLAQLAAPSTGILSESIVTAAWDDFGVVPEKTLGTGPYKVTAWNQGSGLEFEYNDLYWGEEPSVKKVTATIMDPASMDMAFQKGDLDILDCLFLDAVIIDATFKSAYADRIVSIDRLGMNYLMLNEKIEPLSDVKVRKAIQMAIDRQSIVDTVYGGDGKLEDGIYPTGCQGYSNENQGWLKYDPEGAKKLLEEAGYANGFDMELAYDSSKEKAPLEIIAQNLNDVGINATIQTYDHSSWLDLRNSGEMNSFLAVWILDYNDPDNIIYTFFGNEDNTKIRSDNYSNKEVIARVAAAKHIVDDNERIKEYAALEKKLIQEDAAWAPLYSLKHLFVKGERVAEFTPHWAGWSDMYFSGVKLK
ncbi:MAG: ABC transporter substrate-binding protein [Lachnospiraceae bacterium]|nr:ABC transporter substrate-binding protein [Lachnospiraceae bacterium]